MPAGCLKLAMHHSDSQPGRGGPQWPLTYIEVVPFNHPMLAYLIFDIGYNYLFYKLCVSEVLKKVNRVKIVRLYLNIISK